MSGVVVSFGNISISLSSVLSTDVRYRLTCGCFDCSEPKFRWLKRTTSDSDAPQLLVINTPETIVSHLGRRRLRKISSKTKGTSHGIRFGFGFGFRQNRDRRRERTSHMSYTTRPRISNSILYVDIHTIARFFGFSFSLSFCLLSFHCRHRLMRVLTVATASNH